MPVEISTEERERVSRFESERRCAVEIDKSGVPGAFNPAHVYFVRADIGLARGSV